MLVLSRKCAFEPAAWGWTVEPLQGGGDRVMTKTYPMPALLEPTDQQEKEDTRHTVAPINIS